jgi:Tol biopolymer transport system component
MKNHRFGPWTTGLGFEGPPALSTFWRRRLARLAEVRRGRPELSRRDVLKLGAVGLGAASLPALRLRPAEAAIKADGLSGRVFGRAMFFGPDPADRLQGGAFGIFAFTPGGGQYEPAFDKPADHARASPDGKTLAVDFRDALWLQDADGKAPPRKLADIGGIPSWSPDGKALIVCKTIKKGPWLYETWRVDADGKNPVKLDIPQAHTVTDWSADGRLLAVVNGDRGQYLETLRTDGGGARRLTEGFGFVWMPRFSPDGRRVVYSRDDALHVVGVDGKDRQTIYHVDEVVVDHACWSPDGKHIAAVVHDQERDEKGEKIRTFGGGDFRIEVMTAEGKDPSRITPPVIEVIFPDWR